jgi:hypothetical protein
LGESTPRPIRLQLMERHPGPIPIDPPPTSLRRVRALSCRATAGGAGD